jgi:hypothetical protein
VPWAQPASRAIAPLHFHGGGRFQVDALKKRL